MKFKSMLERINVMSIDNLSELGRAAGRVQEFLYKFPDIKELYFNDHIVHACIDTWSFTQKSFKECLVLIVLELSKSKNETVEAYTNYVKNTTHRIELNNEKLDELIKFMKNK